IHNYDFGKAKLHRDWRLDTLIVIEVGVHLCCLVSFFVCGHLFHSLVCCLFFRLKKLFFFFFFFFFFFMFFFFFFFFFVFCLFLFFFFFFFCFPSPSFLLIVFSGP